MVQKTFYYSINLLIVLLLALPIQGQNTKKTASTGQQVTQKEKNDTPVYPLYNGLSIGIDLWGPGGKLLGSDNLTTEISLDANLKNRFLPTIELGYADSKVEGDKGILYQTQAPYFRIGVDYNAFYKKKHGHMLLVGMRYAFSSFKYDISSPGINDPIYGNQDFSPNIHDDIWGESIPFDHSDMKGKMQWLELCLGIRAHIWKQLYMGWALRMRYKLTATTGTYGDPFYVPGYGKYGSHTMGVSYTITYKLPF